MYYRTFIFIFFLYLLIIGCNSSKISKAENSNFNSQQKTENSKDENQSSNKNESNSNIIAEVFGNKENLEIKVEIDKANESSVSGISFNGQKLEKEMKQETDDRKIYFQSSKLSFQKENKLAILMSDKKEYSFRINIEPLDFDVEEPFKFHKNSENTFKLNRKYDSPEELWISTSGENAGGFKEWANFNSERNQIIVPKIDSQKINLGNAELWIHDSQSNDEMKSEDGQFRIKLVTNYESKIKLNVVP